MSKFSIGFTLSDATRSGTGQIRVAAPAGVRPRVNANVRRPSALTWGYLAILGVLTLIAVLSMGMAVWRLFQFAR